MAYSDSIGDNIQLLRRTVTGVTDFSGRSRRTEVIYYWIACALISVVFNFAIGSIFSVETLLVFGNALRLLLWVPMFALFARRVHDQDRSGWWGMLLPVILLLSVPRVAAELRGNIHAIIAQRTTTIQVLDGLLALVALVLCLLPGTDGANRYGPDPRLELT